MNEGKPPEKDAGRPATRPLKDSDAGRVSFRQGNAVWEWNTRTGAFNLEETTMLVRRLDNPELSLEGPVIKRDLTLRGEIAALASAQGSAASAPPHPAPSQAEAIGAEESFSGAVPDDWALQTWVHKSAARKDGKNPYDSAAPAGRGPPGEDRGRTTDWALRSGPNPLPDEPRGFNPYGDDPPPRRKR